jgi:hypothetical protein
MPNVPPRPAVYEKEMCQKLLLTLALCGALCWSGCDYFCAPELINPVFVGFAPGQVDSLVLRWYKPTDNFRTLIDTMLIVNPAVSSNGLSTAIYTTSHDTTLVFINVSPPLSAIYAGYDYQLYMPSTGQTTSFTQITSETTSGTKHCAGLITSFMQDNQLIDAPIFFGTGTFYVMGYRAYIHP